MGHIEDALAEIRKEDAEHLQHYQRAGEVARLKARSNPIGEMNRAFRAALVRDSYAQGWSRRLRVSEVEAEEFENDVIFKRRWLAALFRKVGPSIFLWPGFGRELEALVRLGHGDPGANVGIEVLQRAVATEGGRDVEYIAAEPRDNDDHHQITARRTLDLFFAEVRAYYAPAKKKPSLSWVAIGRLLPEYDALPREQKEAWLRRHAARIGTTKTTLFKKLKEARATRRLPPVRLD